MIKISNLLYYLIIKSKYLILLKIIYILSLLFIYECSLNLNDNLIKNNSFDYISDINIDQILNDTFALDGLYSLNGLNKISEYRAKLNININNKFDDDDFIKLPKDNNKYHFFKLKNDLQVFLVSHQSYISPMISLSIRVGSSMEPKEYPGLATLFNEIMFYEWKRYSDINQETPYNNFISNNNGEFKIKIDPFMTEYYLTVRSEHFIEALMTFSNYFKYPNLKRIYLESTINELQSKFNYLKNLDSERIKQVFKNISINNHINHGFHFFNIDLLKNNSNYDDESLFFELIKFHNKYYSSNLMTLCIISDKSIIELEDYVKNYFDEIPNLNKNLITPFDISKNISHPYLNIRKNIIQIKTINNSQYLTLIFPIPHQIPLWRYKLTEYISFLFTNYSNKSLFYFLKKNDFIINIDTMTEINDNGFSNFIIQYTLSSKNEKNIIKIIESTLSFIKLIQEVPISETIINQIRKKRQSILELNTNYIFKEYSSKIINTFIKINCLPINVLHALTIMDKIDFNYVIEILNYFNYENMILLYTKKEFKKSGSNLLLSNSHYYDSKWNNIKNKFSSLFKNIKKHFQKSKDGIYPNYFIDKYLDVKYTIEEIPIKILEKLSNINSTLANNLLKIEMPDIDPNFPKNFIIYTENITIKEYPINLFSYLKEIEINNNIDNIEEFSSKYHISNPIDINDIKITLDLSKMISYTKNICYLPTEDNPDILFFFKLHLPEKIPKEYKNNFLNKNIERLTILTFLYQYTIYNIIPSYLKKNFIFKENYYFWELQEFFYGIEFNWRGYTSIFPDILDEIIEILLNYEKLLKPNIFLQGKNIFQKLIDQFKLENENLKMISLSYEILDPGFLKISRLEEELKMIDIELLIKFSNFFNQNFAITSSIFGNVTPIQCKYYLIKFIRKIRNIESNIFYQLLELENDNKLNNLLNNNNNNNIHVDNNLNNNNIHVNNNGINNNSNNNEFNINIQNDINYQINTYEKISDKKNKLDKKKKNNFIDEIKIQNITKINNIENLIYIRNTFNNINKLPYKYSNSYFFYFEQDKNISLNIVFLQVHYGYFNEQNLAFLQIVSELNSYKYFLEFSKNNCIDCSLKILPRIILSKYLVLEFKLQSKTKNIKELANLLNDFFLYYYSRPTKMINRLQVEKARDFVILLSRSDHINESKILKDFSFEDNQDLYYISAFNISILKHFNSSCYWKKDYLNFLKTLNYEKFFNYWQYFKTSSKLFISYQTQNTNDELLDSLESYIPSGFIKLTSIDNLYDINEQESLYIS